MNTQPLKAESAHLNPHLNEDDLNDVLIGLNTPATDAHLASCASCAAELATFRETMGSFNKASLAWSQSRSNSMPLQLAPRRATWLRPVGTWAVAGVLAFIVAFFLTSATHHHAAVIENAGLSGQAQGQPTELNREQEIATDNAMLAAINSELYRPIPSPVESYEPTSTRTTDPHPQVKN